MSGACVCMYLREHQDKDVIYTTNSKYTGKIHQLSDEMSKLQVKLS